MRFSYIKYDAQSLVQQQELKEAFEAVEKLVDKLVAGRAKDNCFNHLEESYMWTGKSIRDAQLVRIHDSEEQPERGNE